MKSKYPWKCLVFKQIFCTNLSFHIVYHNPNLITNISFHFTKHILHVGLKFLWLPSFPSKEFQTSSLPPLPSYPISVPIRVPGLRTVSAGWASTWCSACAERTRTFKGCMALPPAEAIGCTSPVVRKSKILLWQWETSSKFQSGREFNIFI